MFLHFFLYGQPESKINPDYAAAYNGLGVAFGRKGLIDKAMELFGSAQRLEPNNPVYNDNLMKAFEIKKSQREIKKAE